MVGEIEGLLKQGIPAEDLIYYGLEYKFVTEYLIGKLSYNEMFRQLEIAIHQFAKTTDDVVSWYGASWLYDSLGKCCTKDGR